MNPPMNAEEAARHLAVSQQIRDRWLAALVNLVDDGCKGVNNLNLYTAMMMLILEISATNGHRPQAELDTLIHEAYVMKNMLNASPEIFDNLVNEAKAASDLN